MPPRSAWLRRAISIPVLLLSTVLLTAVAPWLLLLAGLVDLLRGTASCRTVLFFWGFLLSECVALPVMALGALVAPRGEAMLRWNTALQAWWVRVLGGLLGNQRNNCWNRKSPRHQALFTPKPIGH